MTALPLPRLRVIHQPTGSELARSATLAATFWSRLVGLLGTRSLPAGEGLILDPCNSVHTLGMAYAIDVIFTSPEGEVVRVVHRLRPWRATSIVSGARIVVELPAGAAEAVRPGDRLDFERIER